MSLTRYSFPVTRYPLFSLFLHYPSLLNKTAEWPSLILPNLLVWFVMASSGELKLPDPAVVLASTLTLYVTNISRSPITSVRLSSPQTVIFRKCKLPLNNPIVYPVIIPLRLVSGTLSHLTVTLVYDKGMTSTFNGGESGAVIKIRELEVL